MKGRPTPVGLDANLRIELPPTLGVTEAAEIRDRLIAARGRKVDLDGSKVERLGGLGLQVLLSAHATWLHDGQPLRLVEPSEALSEGLALLGATSFTTTLSGSSP